MSEKIIVTMPGRNKEKKHQSKIVNLNTWFKCDNCGEKSFNVLGCYNVDTDLYCRDCMQDYVEQCENSFDNKVENYIDF